MEKNVQKLQYEAPIVAILSVPEVIATSGGFEGKEHKFDHGSEDVTE